MLIKTRTGAIAAAALMAVAPVAGQKAFAQEGALRPYLGCWEPWEPQGLTSDQGVLCFVAGGSGVEMVTILDGAVEYREPFVADGQPRPVEQDGCRGTESAALSEDGQRIYTESVFSCGEEASQRSSGIISMPAPGQWIDVRAMESGGETTAWSRRYQRVDDSVLEEAGLRSERRPFAGGGAMARAVAGVTADDVIDASKHVDAKAVEAWVAELGQEFTGLDADDLLRMADAGVADAVVDVVVAVSFPERFALNGDRSGGTGETFGPRSGRPIWLSPFGYYDPYTMGYSRYSRYGGYGYGYGYGLGYWGGYGYTPVIVSVNRKAPERGGRVVAGKGYRRGGVTPSGYPASGAGRAAVGRSGGGSRSASPPSRSSTGRKAKKRGG